MDFKVEDFEDDKGFEAYIKTITGEAVSSETASLKSKIDEIIGEKRAATDKLKEIEGLDIAEAKKAMKILKENDYVKKLADGKFDEVLAEKTDQLRTQHEEELEAVNEKLTLSEQRSLDLKVSLDNTRIDSALRKAAIDAGILAEALEDVVVRGRGVYTVGESGEVEARDKNGDRIKIEDKLLTPARWIDTLPRHYWPASSSAGIKGSSAGTDIDAQLTAALKAGDMELYRKLRKTS